MNKVKNCRDESCGKPFTPKHPSELYCRPCKLKRIAASVEKHKINQRSQDLQEKLRIRSGQEAIFGIVFKTKEQKRKEEIMRRYSHGI